MKTWWQRIYSFFGFWKYTDNVLDGKGNCTEYFVLYWCILPFFFIRKIDVFRWRIRTYNVQEELSELRRKLDARENLVLLGNGEAAR